MNLSINKGGSDLAKRYHASGGSTPEQKEKFKIGSGAEEGSKIPSTSINGVAWLAVPVYQQLFAYVWSSHCI